jgi:heme-degrading monooxygenase HmoA
MTAHGTKWTPGLTIPESFLSRADELEPARLGLGLLERRSQFSVFSTDRNLASYMVLYRSNPAASGDRHMFIAMNRFRVIKGSEGAFEHVWLSRDSHLEKVPGFVEFHLLKGPEAEDHTLYASHTVWKSRAVFEAWTKSEAFRAAHSRAGDNKPLYLGHPQFEGFEVCQTVRHGKAEVA